MNQSQVPGLTETFNLTDLAPFQKYKFRLYADYHNLPSGEPFSESGDTTELTTSSKYVCHARHPSGKDFFDHEIFPIIACNCIRVHSRKTTNLAVFFMIVRESFQLNKFERNRKITNPMKRGRRTYVYTTTYMLILHINKLTVIC